MESAAKKRELLIMKLLHYFITEKNYSPVIVHGVQNEIWLENMDNEIRIVRIAMGYIHNKEQLDYDDFKVNRLVKQIKLKTFTYKMKSLTLYLDLNPDIDIEYNKTNIGIKVKTENSLIKDENINKYFPDMKDKLKFTLEGEKLYEKINNDIYLKNMEETNKINDLFKPKKPVVTNILLAIMTLFMIVMTVIGNGTTDTKTLYLFGALINDGNPVRLFTSMFIHIGILHFLMNAWALNILGKQVENFYGHGKTLIIFLYSGIVGNLVSLLFLGESTISAGASGAIFGLMGALLYFAINQRTYMGEALKKEILPVIIINLVFGMMLPSINMYAHIGGLISGIIVSIAVGVKYKSSKFEKTNGLIVSIVLLVGLAIMIYFK